MRHAMLLVGLAVLLGGQISEARDRDKCQSYSYSYSCCQPCPQVSYGCSGWSQPTWSCGQAGYYYQGTPVVVEYGYGSGYGYGYSSPRVFSEPAQAPAASRPLRTQELPGLPRGSQSQQRWGDFELRTLPR